MDRWHAPGFLRQGELRMLQEVNPGRSGSGQPIRARERLLQLLDARRTFLAGDVERALGAYAKLLDPARPQPIILHDLRRILLRLEEMAAADPEFRLARHLVRMRLSN